MTTFVIPYEGEPLIKALTKTKPLKQNLGSWQGMPVIAIGPKGGKIVGYGSGGKPIYAGSKQAKTLAAISKQEGTKKTDSTGEWLLALGIPNKIEGSAVYVQPESAALLEAHFAIVGTKVGGAVKFSFTEVFAHVGEPLKPQGDEQQAWAASMAAGEIDEDPFPDLSTLKQLPAGKYAGSHGNLLFEDPSGRKWIFKGEDPTIARAEEAASRIGRLIMGNTIPPAKHVEIQGQPGVLVGELPGHPLNEESHSNPPLAMLQKYAGQIVQHQVVDWLTSNHDGHAGNFLSDGKTLNGIDKGQAWKFFGKDSLDPDYSPNPSKPIYVAFWNAVKDGLISMDDIIGPIGDALAKAETISDQQFKSIIAPYVSTAAGHIGFDPQKKAAAMTKRLQNLRADFEALLSGVAQKPVQIPKKSADNFETMPEAEGLPGEPKLTIKVPDKPKVIEGGPKAPVQTGEKVAGWPMTKGKVTITNPGQPSPGGTWPKGYPGPGFKASIDYKKQTFTVDFTVDMQGNIAVGVYYPDGSFKPYTSPNQASDSIYCYVKGLPLDMTATEKKAKGISLPATKLFGIKAFQDELTKAHAGETPIAAMEPAELEKEGVIEKDAPELTVKAVFSKMPDGVVDDWDELPHAVKESLLANQFEIGSDYPHAIPPGVAFKTTEDGHPVLYTVLKGNTPDSHKYMAWDWLDDGEAMTAMDVYPPSIDGTHDLDSNAMLQSLKKDMVQDTPVTADEQIGAPPPAELPATAVVPESAPQASAGPVPPGTSISVTKKFKTEGGTTAKSDVTLTVTEDGKFKVELAHEKGFPSLTKTFDSLSAASDHVWVKQKGYSSIEDYKAKTGKAKIPSGGGWKFWGIKPGEPTAPKPSIPNAPGMQTLGSFPTMKELDAIPVGGVLVWTQQDGAYKAKKTAVATWEFTSPKVAAKSITTNTLDLGDFHLTADTVKLKVPPQEPVAPVDVPETLKPGEWNAITSKPPSYEMIVGDTAGTQYKFHNTATGDLDIVVKQFNGLWKLNSNGALLTSDEVKDAVENGFHEQGMVQKFLGAAETPSESNFETMPKVPDLDGLGQMKTGTILEFSSLSADYKVTKLGANKWEVAFGSEKGVHTSKYVHELMSAIDEKDPNFEVDSKAPAAPSDPNWETMPIAPEFDALNAMPDGTKIKYWDNDFNGWAIATKTTAQGHAWEVENDMTGQTFKLSNSTVASDIDKTHEEHPVQKFKGSPAPAPVPAPAPAPVKAKVSKANAVEAEMKKVWGSKFKMKASNKAGHTNVLLGSKAGGKEALQALAAKHGLTITNSYGEPKFSYGSWWMTIPNSDLELMTESDIPADAPVPESATEVAAPAETEKEEPKWAAVGAISGGKYQQLIDAGYSVKWPEDVLPDDNVDKTFGVGPITGSHADKLKETGLVVIHGKKKKPKPKVSKEQKAKLEKAKEVGEWLKKNPGISDAKTQLVLAHFQDLFDLHKKDMRAWAREAGKGSIIVGSPDSEFAELMADMEKTQGLKTEKVETPLGTFWKVKVDDLAEAIPGQPAGTVEGPDGKTYPKGTTWEKQETTHTVAELLHQEPGFYKIKDHKSDPDTKVLKVAGTSEEKKAQLLAMATKWNLTHTGAVAGGSNWLLFVPTKQLEAVGKTETTYEATSPPQPKPFISAPYPTMGAAKPGQEGISNRADLSSIQSIEIGKFSHAVRMGAAGTFKNSQVYVRKVKAADGKTYYEVHGELERFDVGKSSLNPSYGLSMPSAMTKSNPDNYSFKLHNFEGGEHDESGPNAGTIMSAGGYAGQTPGGGDIKLWGGDQESFRNVFSVRIPESADIETELAAAFDSMGLNAAEAMREQTADDERIAIKSAIVKAKIGAQAWMKSESNSVFPPSKRYDEAWLDQKLTELGVTPEMVASARFETTFDNHQSVVIDDKEIQKSAKVKFVYMGMSEEGVFYQIKDGSGWGSRSNRYLNGIEQSGASAESDVSVGGANGVFCRIGSSQHGANSDWGLKCGGWKVIFHKRCLDRTDWRFYRADSFGKTNGYDSDMKPRNAVMESMSTSNEVLFDEGISVRDVAGIVAPSESQKQALIQRFQKEGINDVNGIPLNDLIQVQTTHSRTQTAKQFVGLKKGVLP